MSLVEHAKRELERIGAFDKDKDFYEGRTGKAVLELVEVFAKQRHSGMSASLVRQLFDKVANYEPLSPLTGDDSEWNEIGDGMYQNNRCGRVFKHKDGTAFDADGKVFVKPNGAIYTSNDSFVDVTFPYIPKTVFINVEK